MREGSAFGESDQGPRSPSNQIPGGRSSAEAPLGIMKMGRSGTCLLQGRFIPAWDEPGDPFTQP